MRSQLILTAALVAGLFAFDTFAPTALARHRKAQRSYSHSHRPYYRGHSSRYAKPYRYRSYSHRRRYYRHYSSGYVVPYGYRSYSYGRRYSSGYAVPYGWYSYGNLP